MKTTFTSVSAPAVQTATAASAPQIPVGGDYLPDAGKRMQAASADAAKLLRTSTAKEAYAGFVRLAREHKLTPAGLGSAVATAYDALCQQGISVVAGRNELGHALVSAEHVVSGGVQAPLYQLFRDLTVVQTYVPGLLQRSH